MRRAQRDLGAMTQWQLVRLRFARHRLAVWSLWILAVLYTVALGCEFFAPYAPTRRDLERTWSPAQPLRFNFRHGLHVWGVRQARDPVSLGRVCRADPSHIVPIGFFVKGEPYRLAGLVPWDRHFLGIAARGGESRAESFFLLGSDKYGRDVFSRIVYGARISLSIGFVAIVITLVLGTAIGGVSGYAGGWADTGIQRGIEILDAFPKLPLWLALGTAVPVDWAPIKTYFAITLVLAALGWAPLARVVRGRLLSLREEDYAMAARLLGASHGRILFRHLVPGLTSHIIVVLTLSVPGMILGETALSFLGLGLRPPVVSWGVMLQDCLNMRVVANYPWLLMPLPFIVLTVLCFNFLGDGLRDAADPYRS